MAEPSAGPCSEPMTDSGRFGDVGVDLHEQRVLHQSAGDDQLGDRDAGGVERLDDLARAERRGFQQRAVDVLGAGGQRLADDDAGQFVVDEDRPVAAVPVEGDQAVFADLLLGGQPGELGVPVVGEVLGEPAEDVADAALPGLVAPQPGDDPAVDDPAHAGDLAQFGAVHHVAGRGAHDRDHLAGLDGVRGGRGDVGVDVADGDRDALGQPGPGGGFGGQRAGAGAQLRPAGVRACRPRRTRTRVPARGGSHGSGTGRPGGCPCTRRCRRCGRSGR